MATLVYRSSAGSGKTYTLARNFLLLVLCNGKLPNYSQEQTKHFRNILAVTFTKKATAEMKQRIVKNLYEIANLDTISDKSMAHSIMEELAIDEEEIQKRAQFQLEFILEQYGDLNISTIDSFFRTVLSSFALELDSAANTELELDIENVINGVTSILYKNLSEQNSNSQLFKSFKSFLYDSFYNNNELLDINKLLNDQVHLILNTEFQEKAKVILAAYQDFDLLLNFRNQVYNEQKRLATKVTEALNSFIQFCNDNNIDEAQFAGKSRGLRTQVEKSLNNFAFLPKINNCIEKEQFLKSPSKNNAHPFNEAIIHLAYEIKSVADIYADFQTIVEKFRRLNASIFIVYLFEFLKQYKLQNKVIPINELNFLIRGITGGNELHFIYEKLGRKIKHLFIDEFQDTNELQWKNLLPIIDNNNSEGKLNLIVGDVKQSIYKFRGGDLELLQSKINEDIDSEYLICKNLSDNYRSFETIVEFNNNLFNGGFTNYIKEHFDKINFSLSSKGNYLVDAYADAAQTVKVGKGQGFVEVNFFHSVKPAAAVESNETLENNKDVENESSANEDIASNDSEDKVDVSALSFVFDKIYQLQDNGVSMGEMAILIFKNSEGQAVANYAQTYALEKGKVPLSFISSDGLKLGGARVISLLVSAIKYLINPNDEVQMYTLFTQYMDIQGKPLEVYQVDLMNFGKNLSKQYAFLSYMKAKREEWLRLSVYALVSEIITHLQLMANENGKLKGEILHINTFLQQAHDYTQKQCGDANSFIKWFEAYGINKNISTPESATAIRILTVHKSKGLEYPIVFLPFFNIELFKDKPFDWVCNKVLYDNHSKKLMEVNDYVFEQNVQELNEGNAQLKEKDVFFNEELKENDSLYTEKRVLEILDNINKIYVATTRPIKACYIYIKSYFSLKELLSSAIINELEASQYDVKYSGFTKKAQSSGYWLMHYFLNTPYFIGALQESQAKYASFKFGDENSIYHSNNNSKKLVNASGYFNTKIPFYAVGNRLSIRNIAKDFFQKKLHHQLLQEADSSEHINQKLFGTVLHRVLAEISPDTDIEYLCNDLLMKGELSEKMALRLKANLQALMNKQEIKPFFNPQLYTRVFTERAIIEKDKDGNTLTYIPDRVLLGQNELILIDFKSGEEREEHKKQVEKYKSLLSKIYPDKVAEGFLLYIGENSIDTLKV